MDYQYHDIAKMIDHALLQPSTNTHVLENGISLALAYDVASVCIVPYYVSRCAERLAGSSVAVCTVIGFPHGASATSVKLAEARQAIDDGCHELDMVVNISQVLSRQWGYVRDEIGAVVQVAHDAGRKVKVIFENCYLNDEHKIRLCEICGEVDADWVKTSTGFGTGGATIEDLKLMRQHAPSAVQIKAAGGVRDLDTALQVAGLGVSRIGASATQSILDQCRERLGLEPIQFNADPSASGY